MSNLAFFLPLLQFNYRRLFARSGRAFVPTLGVSELKKGVKVVWRGGDEFVTELRHSLSLSMGCIVSDTITAPAMLIIGSGLTGVSLSLERKSRRDNGLRQEQEPNREWSN